MTLAYSYLFIIRIHELIEIGIGTACPIKLSFGLYQPMAAFGTKAEHSAITLGHCACPPVYGDGPEYGRVWRRCSAGTSVRTDK